MMDRAYRSRKALHAQRQEIASISTGAPFIAQRQGDAVSTKEPTTLECAAETLQAAHDYIEVNGFDITTYEPYNKASCYIGTVRLVAGLSPKPRQGHKAAVTAALKMLDQIAIDEGADLIFGKREGGTSGAGKFIESLGFQKAAEDLTDNEQRDYALTILRKALTEIHNG